MLLSLSLRSLASIDSREHDVLPLAVPRAPRGAARASARDPPATDAADAADAADARDGAAALRLLSRLLLTTIATQLRSAQSRALARSRLGAAPTVPRGERRGLLAQLPFIPEYQDARDYPRLIKHVITFVIAFASITGPMGTSIMLPAIDDILRDLHTSASTVNVLVGTYLLALGIFPLWWLAFSEQVGRRLIYVVLFILFCGFLVGAALSNSIGELIGFRVLCGGCLALVQAVGAGTISDLFVQEERGTAMGIYYLGPLMGPFLAPILGGVVAQVWGWRATQWLMVIFLGCNVVLILFVLPETLRRQDTEGAIRDILRLQLAVGQSSEGSIDLEKGGGGGGEGTVVDASAGGASAGGASAGGASAACESTDAEARGKAAGGAAAGSAAAGSDVAAAESAEAAATYASPVKVPRESAPAEAGGGAGSGEAARESTDAAHESATAEAAGDRDATARASPYDRAVRATLEADLANGAPVNFTDSYTPAGTPEGAPTLTDAQLERIATTLSRTLLRTSRRHSDDDLVFDGAMPLLLRLRTGRSLYLRRADAEVQRRYEEAVLAAAEGAMDPDAAPAGPPWRTRIYDVTLRPLHLLVLFSYPPVLLVILFLAVTFCVVYFFNLTILYEYLRPPYHFKTIIVGLLYIPNLVTYVAALIIGGRWNDWLLRRYAARHHGEVVPELRFLWNLVVAACLFPPALLIFGWCLRYGTQWVTPLIGTAIFGFALMLVIGATVTFLVDTLPGKGATGVALNNLVRMTLAAVATFVVDLALEGVGPGVLFLILLGIVLLSTVPILVAKRGGPYFRRHYDLERLYDML